MYDALLQCPSPQRGSWAIILSNAQSEVTFLYAFAHRNGGGHDNNSNTYGTANKIWSDFSTACPRKMINSKATSRNFDILFCLEAPVGQKRSEPEIITSKIIDNSFIYRHKWQRQAANPYIQEAGTNKWFDIFAWKTSGTTNRSSKLVGD